MIKTQKMEYRDGQTVLEGYYAFDSDAHDLRPAIMVVHDWSGRNEFAEKKAQALAELGYVGFALDMYGKGKMGKSNDEKGALMQPFMTDRRLLQQRIQAAFEAIKKIPGVDAANIGVIGFCFGGLCALDLARSGAMVKGVVSFHGLLNPPPFKNEAIQAKILALHGHDDPMGAPTQVLAFETEMTAAHVDWQLHVYGRTKHAFMNPLANDQALGLVYNPLTERRAWALMKDFFEEIFSICLIRNAI